MNSILRLVVTETCLNRALLAVAITAVSPGVDADVLAHGQERLEWLYKGESLDYWRLQLKSDQPKAREQAIQAAASFASDEPKQVMELLIGLLSDSDSNVRRTAIWNLSSVRGQPDCDEAELIDALLERLLDSEETQSVRHAAARELAEFFIAGATALSRAINRVESSTVRSDVLEVLSRIPSDLHDKILSLHFVQSVLRQLSVEESKADDRVKQLRIAIEQIEEPTARAHALGLMDVADRIADIAVESIVAEINSVDASPAVRCDAISRLLPLAQHESSRRAGDALSDALNSEDEELKFWAATLLAAIDPASQRGEQAVDVLVDDLVRHVQVDDDSSEQLAWRFRFATMGTERRADIFRRVADRIEDENGSGFVQAMRFSILEGLDLLTPELLNEFLDCKSMYVSSQAAAKLVELDAKYAGQSASALFRLLQSLPEDDRAASRIASDAVRLLAEIDPDGELTPSTDAEEVVRLIYLNVGGPWLQLKLRDLGEAGTDAVVKYIQAMPSTKQPTSFERNLAGNSPSERFTRALSQLGDAAVPGLRRVVISCQADYRGWDASNALNWVGPAGDSALVELSQHEKDAVRQLAVYGLRYSLPTDEAPDPRVFDALVRTAKEGATSNRIRALSAFARVQGSSISDAQFQQLFPVLVDSLHAENQEVASRAIYPLRQLVQVDPERVIGEFRKVLRQWDPKRKLPVLNALKQFGEKSSAALPELCQIIVGDEPHRTAALEVIAHMGPTASKAEPLLREALDSPERWDRLWAATALAQFEDHVDSAVPVLVEVLKSGKRTRFQGGRDPRIFAAQVLSGLGEAAEPTIDALIEVVRLQSDSEAGNAYETDRVRQAAVTALGKIGAQQEIVVPVLGQVLELERDQSVDRGLIREALSALHSFGDGAELASEGIVACLKDSEVRPMARESLLAMGDKAVPALAGALTSDEKTAEHAAELLGEMKDLAAPAVPELLLVVRDRGATIDLRVAAIKALGTIGDPARPAIRYLEVLSQQGLDTVHFVRKLTEAAQEALLRLGR